MNDLSRDDPLLDRVCKFDVFIKSACEKGYYFFNQPIEHCSGSRILVNGRAMSMFASYSYLGLIGHPRINAAAKSAVDKYGTGTHGVRLLAGSLPIHKELEEIIADYHQTEAAITFSSGFVTNVSVISALAAKDDYIFSDTFNHASIVDGCCLSHANLVRFNHNNMDDLERCLKDAPMNRSKLIVADAVFSMDGDIIDLPRVVELSRKYKAWLMIDEAHSLGVLGKTGRGIEEHFGMANVIDIKMGTLSKTIPSTGGYVAGKRDLLLFIRHFSRGYIFSAALAPAQAAAAIEAFKVIRDESWRIDKIKANAHLFISGLQERGFNTLNTRTPIVPLICGTDKKSVETAKAAHERGIFVLPIPSIGSAVPLGLARLRATVTASHEPYEIEQAMDILREVGLKTGILR
jgi:8-amino-7-oxononanoate synthase